jgi:hypothetical protein
MPLPKRQTAPTKASKPAESNSKSPSVTARSAMRVQSCSSSTLIVKRPIADYDDQATLDSPASSPTPDSDSPRRSTPRPNSTRDSRGCEAIQTSTTRLPSTNMAAKSQRTPERRRLRGNTRQTATRMTTKTRMSSKPLQTRSETSLS